MSTQSRTNLWRILAFDFVSHLLLFGFEGCKKSTGKTSLYGTFLAIDEPLLSGMDEADVESLCEDLLTSV
jgi:hypothetical protein